MPAPAPKEATAMKTYARLVFKPMGRPVEVFCATREELRDMIDILINQKYWFDVDFPNMEQPTNPIKS